MIVWNNFLNEVLPYVENCPTPIVKQHLRNAAIEFCQRTALWHQELAVISVVQDQYTYDLTGTLTTDEAISGINYAYLTETDGETPLNVTTEDEMNAHILVWQVNTATKPDTIMMLDTVNCRLYPIPEVAIANSLVVGLILKPSRASTGVPDWIYEQYAEAIAHGAKARLMGMKGRSWYSPEEGIDEQGDFDLAITDATIRTNKGNSRRNSRVKMIPFA